jgi:phosphate transport system ATP-binding protein
MLAALLEPHERPIPGNAPLAVSRITIEIYAPTSTPEVRRRIGAGLPAEPVSKTPTTTAFGARVNGYPGNMNELVERLRQAAPGRKKDDLEVRLALSGASSGFVSPALAVQPTSY